MEITLRRNLRGRRQPVKGGEPIKPLTLLCPLINRVGGAFPQMTWILHRGMDQVLACCKHFLKESGNAVNETKRLTSRRLIWPEVWSFQFRSLAQDQPTMFAVRKGTAASYRRMEDGYVEDCRIVWWKYWVFEPLNNAKSILPHSEITAKSEIEFSVASGLQLSKSICVNLPLNYVE